VRHVTRNQLIKTVASRIDCNRDRTASLLQWRPSSPWPYALPCCDTASVTPTSRNFSYMLPMSMARSFSGGVAIRFLVPVLLMTSQFHIMMALRCVVSISKWQERNSRNQGWIKTKLGLTLRCKQDLFLLACTCSVFDKLPENSCLFSHGPISGMGVMLKHQ